MENSFLPKISYESIIQNFPDPFWIVDAQSLTIAGVNAAYCQMSGFEESEIVGKNAEEFELPQEESDANSRVQLIIKTKKLLYTAGHIKKDGSTAIMEVVAHYEEVDKRGFIFAFMRDCSARLELEDKFQKLNSKLINTATSETKKRITKELAFATIFEALSAGLAIADKNGVILDVNKRFLSLFGLTDKLMALKQNFINFAIEEDEEGIKHRQNIADLLGGANCGCLLKAECAESEHKQCEAAFKMGCGRRIDAIVGVSCYKIGFEEAHFIFSITDVTQIRVLEKKERQVSGLLASQNRMAAMGEMIGAISHQWRQPLNILGVLVQELPELFEENALTKESIAKIVFDSMKQIYFMSKTIDDFNGFFRKDKKRIDFNLAFETKEALSLISETLRTKGIEVTFTQELNPVVTGFSNEYKQVVLNLLSNAKDALESKKSPQKSQINILISSDQTYGILKISDNAGGIPKGAIDKIFEPYFTTKPEGKGTGIGLYMSKTIVETNMGGSIKAYNEENGAIFVVKLPLAVSSLEGK